jgi:hypothetical protein
VATVVQHDLVVQLHADPALLVYLGIDRPLVCAISSPLTLQADPKVADPIQFRNYSLPGANVFNIIVLNTLQTNAYIINQLIQGIENSRWSKL